MMFAKALYCRQNHLLNVLYIFWIAQILQSYSVRWMCPFALNSLDFFVPYLWASFFSIGQCLSQKCCFVQILRCKLVNGYYARHLVWHSQAQCQFIVNNTSKSRLLIHNRCIQGTSKSLFVRNEHWDIFRQKTRCRFILILW